MAAVLDVIVGPYVYLDEIWNGIQESADCIILMVPEIAFTFAGNPSSKEFSAPEYSQIHFVFVFEANSELVLHLFPYFWQFS